MSSKGPSLSLLPDFLTEANIEGQIEPLISRWCDDPIVFNSVLSCYRGYIGRYSPPVLQYGLGYTPIAGEECEVRGVLLPQGYDTWVKGSVESFDLDMKMLDGRKTAAVQVKYCIGPDESKTISNWFFPRWAEICFPKMNPERPVWSNEYLFDLCMTRVVFTPILVYTATEPGTLWPGLFQLKVVWFPAFYSGNLFVLSCPHEIERCSAKLHFRHIGHDQIQKAAMAGLYIPYGRIDELEALVPADSIAISYSLPGPLDNRVLRSPPSPEHPAVQPALQYLNATTLPCNFPHGLCPGFHIDPCFRDWSTCAIRYECDCTLGIEGQCTKYLPRYGMSAFY